MTVIQLHNSHPEIAFWLMTPNDDACEIAALLGYGTVIIDMEHGTFDTVSAARSMTVGKALGLRVFTRVGSADRVPIQHALDFGSNGVILPQIADLAHAESATRYAKYPPIGCRGFGGGRTVRYLPAPDHFVTEENERVKCWVMIETTGAFDAVEKIAGLQSVDGLFIGPNDLSLARGRGEFRADGKDHADISRIAVAARAAGKPWAMPVASLADRTFATQLGVAFIAISDDMTALRDGLEVALHRMELV
jgi:2-dehydro-3-deoxyglucarate aldolase/4-hydroxy-2-oxoheptanedioate aldolase